MGASNTKPASSGEKTAERTVQDRMDAIMEDACIALHLRVKEKVMKMSTLPTAVRDKHISIFLENLTSSREFFQWELYQALRSRLTIKYWVRVHHRIFEDSDETLDITVRHVNRRELSAVIEIRKAPISDRLTLKRHLGRLSYLIAIGKAERGYLVVYGTYPKGFQPPVPMIDRDNLRPVTKTVSVHNYSEDYLERAKVKVMEGTDWSEVAERETVAAGVAKFSMDLPEVVKLQPEKFRIRVYRLENRFRDDVDGRDDVTNPIDVIEDVMSPPRGLESPVGLGNAVDDVTPSPPSLESSAGLGNQVPTLTFTTEERLEFKQMGLDLSPRDETQSLITVKPEPEETTESGGETEAMLDTYM